MRLHAGLFAATTVFVGTIALTGCSGAERASVTTATVTVTSPAPESTNSVSTAARPTAVESTESLVTQTGPKSVIPTDGTYLVGTDIQPGMYRSTGSSDCYWARLASLDTSDIIDNNLSAGPQVVEILHSDRAFLTEGCPRWTLASTATSSASPTVEVPSAGQFRAPAAGGLTCDSRVALTLRTTLSVVAICDEGGGRFTYKGLRLKDGARIDVPGARPTATGFTALNAGTTYEVSPTGLLIITADGEVYSESAAAVGP